MSEAHTGELDRVYQAMRATGLVGRIFDLARDEDLGPNLTDLTSTFFVDENATLRSGIVAHEAGVVAGAVTIPDLLKCFQFDQSIDLSVQIPDGHSVEKGQVIATLTGRARAIVTIERTILNLLGRLSGIATTTRRYMDVMGTGHRAVLLDTRKTTPGLRVLEKYAVRCGGGQSHRLGLYDAIMVKDNHIAGVRLDHLAARLRKAGANARQHASGAGFVEVEVDSIEQIKRVLELEPGLIDYILLDNMATDQLREAVALRDRAAPTILLEASGGVSLNTIRAIALTGVERISVGALTHSSVNLDLGLDAI